MKKTILIKISVFIVFALVLGGLLLRSDVYCNVRSNIVSKLCLSCIKLDPIPKIEFVFETANNQPYSDFVLDKLNTTPIFIYYSKDACGGCDIMKPILEDIFNVNFNKDELFFKQVEFDESNVSFIHINIEHAPNEMSDSSNIYDKEHQDGFPMFVVVTLGNNSGHVEPYYATVYATLGLDKNIDRKTFLENMILDGIDFYNKNSAEYKLD
jgi:thiol-disulfide isomerase/thioredoxin